MRVAAKTECKFVWVRDSNPCRRECATMHSSAKMGWIGLEWGWAGWVGLGEVGYRAEAGNRRTDKPVRSRPCQTEMRTSWGDILGSCWKLRFSPCLPPGQCINHKNGSWIVFFPFVLGVDFFFCPKLFHRARGGKTVIYEVIYDPWWWFHEKPMQITHITPRG